MARQSIDQTADGVGRRQFLLRAAVLGLSAGAMGALSRAWTGLGSAEAAVSRPVARRLLTPKPAPGARATALLEATGPAYDLSSTRVKIGHLLRRAGFGASQQEAERFTQMGVEATVDHLVNYEGVDDGDMERRLAELEQDLDLERLGDLQQWWFFRMMRTARPLQEKMTLFWHGHLTSAFSKVGRGPRMLDQNHLYRQHALGKFDDLLKAVSRDPAMLIYLDSRTNRKEAPNENFARELMELFSLGIGNYTEEDVRESARAFTGWSLGRQGFVFRRRWHDGGPKTFLGKTGSFDGDDVVDIILEQPASAHFIARKLFEFFAYDDPEPEVLARLADTFRRERYDVRAVVRQILTSPEFYSAQAYRAKIKSPVELVAGTLHTLGIEVDGKGVGGLATLMGQMLLNPARRRGVARRSLLDQQLHVAPARQPGAPAFA